MLEVHRIDRLDLPALEPYRSMRRQEEQRREGLFIAEGDKVVLRLLAAPSFTVVSVLVPPDWLERLTPQLERRPETITAYVADKRILESLTGYPLYQGVLALGQVPALPTLPALLPGLPRPLLLAAMEGITNAPNVGVIMRNCAAFGVQALIAGPTSSSPYLRRAVRSSMGAVFEVPVVEPPDLLQAIAWLRQQGVQCLAAHPRPGSRPLDTVDLSSNSCFIFGAEGEGVTEPVAQACDMRVIIPVEPTVDSLNVGSASAVVFYEARRQRQQLAINSGATIPSRPAACGGVHGPV